MFPTNCKIKMRIGWKGEKETILKKEKKIEKPYLNNLVKENLKFSAHSLFKKFYTIIFL